MGKFSKRLTKENRNLKNVLVLGSAFGNLLDLVENNINVFVVYPKDETLRRKNIIYREELDSAYVLMDVDFIIVDKDLIHIIPELQPVWKKQKTIIIIEGSTNDSINQHKFLTSQRYQITEIKKDYHIWKIK
jgi:hypothetical protein